MRILIVDDDITDLTAVSGLLRLWNYQVETASGAAEALEIIENGSNPPDIAIIDWLMPGMDGLELCRTIRNRGMERMHIILLTCKTSKEDLAMGLEAGANDYIPKPFDQVELKARVRAGERVARIERSLMESLSRLSKSNTALEMYAHVVSHDLKNPIASIMGLAELLSRRPSVSEDSRAREIIMNIASSSERMNLLVDTLLDMSERNMAVQASEAVDLNKLTAQVLDCLDAAIQEAGPEILIDPEMPPVRCPSMEIFRILQNLLANALKFRAPGRPLRISVSARLVNRVDDLRLPMTLKSRIRENQDVIITIADNGMGIPRDMHEKVFDFRQRVHGHIPGTGLGLAQVRALVASMDGLIWIDSEPERGTTVFFTVPKA